MIEVERRCGKCSQGKAESDFPTLDQKTGRRHSWCRKCLNAYKRDWNAANPQKVARRKLRYKLKKFGISQETHDRLLRDQGFACAICRQPETYAVGGVPQSLAIDHDHGTGEVRGLLCRKCNLGLALFEEDSAAFLRAIEYLACWPIKRLDGDEPVVWRGR